MAEAEASKAEESSAPEKKKFKLPSGPVLLALGNTLVIVLVAVLLIYAKMIYKRPQITEEFERDRLEKLGHSAHAAHFDDAPGMYPFEAFTVNLSQLNSSKDEEGPTALDVNAQQKYNKAGRYHYAVIGMALSLRDIAQKTKIDAYKPVILDKIMTLISTKTRADLITVQGRYILRSEILRAVNIIIYLGPRALEAIDSANHEDTVDQLPKELLVTDVFFSQLQVQ